MRNLYLLLALTSTALAAPLLQTKSSVAEGNFCKTYGCSLVRRTVVMPETMHTFSYEYAVQGHTLMVGRLYTKDIYFGALYLPASQWNSPVVRDFFSNLAGLTPEPSTLRACVKAVLSSGSNRPTPISSGKVGGIGFIAECRAERGGQVSFTVMDDRDLFR